MKKTLKLVAILISVLIVVIVGGLSIYFLVQNNKTYYIYDLRLVEPVSNVYGYVYTDNEMSYDSINNKKVYLQGGRQNYFKIGVYARTSNGLTNIYPESSNPDVARITYLNGDCCVNYLKAGETTISVSIGSVTDSFTLTVYDQIAENFAVYDNRYYGDFKEYYPNKIVTYSDSTLYSYDYVVSTSITNSAHEINNDRLRIVNVDTNIIEKISIDAAGHKLLVACKSGLENDVDTTITVQSYTYAEDGSVKVLNSQNVDLHVVAHTPEFLQIVLSTTPDFEDNCVFVDTKPIDPSKLTEDEILNHLEDYLDYKKTEQNLESVGEKAIYNVYFTEKVDKIYLKLRKVYTNGDVVELNPNDSENNPYLVTTDTNHFKPSANGNYYILTLSESDFSSGSFRLRVRLNGENFLEHEFVFEYAKFNLDNIKLFYSYDNGIFTYTYWDNRTHFVNEIYDEKGNIIGFAGIDTSSFENRTSGE